jgi:hypothetical protein
MVPMTSHKIHKSQGLGWGHLVLIILALVALVFSFQFSSVRDGVDMDRSIG